MAADRIAKDLGIRLREAREAAGLAQNEVAEAAGRQWQAVSDWERGVRRPPWRVLAQLEKLLGWPHEVFVEGGPRPAAKIHKDTAALFGHLAAHKPSHVSESTDTPGWQFRSDLPDEELVELMLHDRPGFLRYLQSEWGGKPLPLEAKKGRLEWLARKAKELGHQLDEGYVAWLLEGIKRRSL